MGIKLNKSKVLPTKKGISVKKILKTAIFFLSIFVFVNLFSFCLFSDERKKIVSLNLEKVETLEIIKVLSKLANLDLICDGTLTGEVSISLNNIEVKEAFEKILQSAGAFYKKDKNFYFIVEREKFQKQENFTRKIYLLNHLNAKEALDFVKPLLKNGETATFESQSNSLIIFASPFSHEDFEQLIFKLDQPARQVTIEAKIVEVSSDSLKNLGIQWPKKFIFSSDSQETGGIITFEDNKLQAVLNLLEEKGASKVLANPRLLVLNNQEANILIGDRIPYQVTNVSPTGAVSSKIEFIEAGVKLKIIPRINSLSELEVTICPEVSYVYNWKGPNAEIPWVKTREAKTKIRVRNGETIFIAGLLNEDEKENWSGVPLLSQIPGAGHLFLSKRKDKTRSEIIISITPFISI